LAAGPEDSFLFKPARAVPAALERLYRSDSRQL
jgi:hypothetical protein